jgi:hypothetical protein
MTGFYKNVYTNNGNIHPKEIVNMKATVVTFSDTIAANHFFADCTERNVNFRVHDLGKCAVDNLRYFVVHTMPKNKPSKLISAVYRGIVSRERRYSNIYLGD